MGQQPMVVLKAFCVAALFAGGVLYGKDAAAPGLIVAGAAAVALAILDASAWRRME